MLIIKKSNPKLLPMLTMLSAFVLSFIGSASVLYALDPNASDQIISTSETKTVKKPSTTLASTETSVSDPGSNSSDSVWWWPTSASNQTSESSQPDQDKEINEDTAPSESIDETNTPGETTEPDQETEEPEPTDPEVTDPEPTDPPAEEPVEDEDGSLLDILPFEVDLSLDLTAIIMPFSRLFR